MSPRRIVFAALASLLVSFLAFPPASQAQQGREVARIGAQARVTVFAEGLEHPWGLAFLPDGRALVTERPGRLRIVGRDGQLSPALQGVPAVFASGQGGMLDIAADPRFSENRMIYVSFAERGNGGAGSAVARARMGEGRLENLQVIYRQDPKVGGGLHFGSRLVFGRDGNLFVTQGDRYTQMQRAQELSDTIGKIIRIRPDGSIPPDNPFVGRAGARSEIWSYGHRNVQGAALNPETGQLWTHEHGARGGDEINLPEAGKNYGWPVITHGVDYSGAKIGIGTSAPSMEQPLHQWTPSIAPSGMAFYSGQAFPQWRGSLFVGALRAGQLVRLTIRDGKVAGEERLLGDLGERIRDVRQGPDGFLYLLTDSPNGRILRIEPPARS